MKTSRSAFTFVEIMIVVVILGLLAAMAIPAFIKVGDNSIIKKHDSGVLLSRTEQVRYEEALSRTGSSHIKASRTGGSFQAEPSNTLGQYGTMDINGEKYFMVPADRIKSKTEINGTYYYLVPAK
jgi:prepilin-type N-terminal cleavage/methylation domain-containing protein